uniref:Cytochrome-c oxidase n=1 Tax=Steinernema glaseri TaxID=37863 RepID=A0A1I7YVB4_9BILA
MSTKGSRRDSLLQVKKALPTSILLICSHSIIRIGSAMLLRIATFGLLILLGLAAEQPISAGPLPTFQDEGPLWAK